MKTTHTQNLLAAALAGALAAFAQETTTERAYTPPIWFTPGS